MSAPSDDMEETRIALVAMCVGAAMNVRLEFKRWPTDIRVTPSHTAAARLVFDLEDLTRRSLDELEVERAQCASAEKGGRA